MRRTDTISDGDESTKPTNRRGALKTIGAASAGIVGGIFTLSSPAAADGFQAHDGGSQTTYEKGGETIGEFTSTITGPANAGGDNEVQMVPYLESKTNDNPYDDKSWVLTKPRLKFETVNEPSGGDVYITNVETYLQDRGGGGYPQELVEFAASTIESLARLPAPVLSVFLADGPSTNLSRNKEELKIDYTNEGGSTQSAWWLTHFGGDDPNGRYKFKMTAKMDLGYWEKSRYRTEYHYDHTTEHEHTFSITV